MAEQLLDGNGSGYYLAINPDGSINTVISGAIFIGSVSATVDSVYVQSGANLTGSFYQLETNPRASIYNNPVYQYKYVYSGTATGAIGSEIGSIIQFIGVGSYVQTINYLNGVITSIGSWS